MKENIAAISIAYPNFPLGMQALRYLWMLYGFDIYAGAIKMRRAPTIILKIIRITLSIVQVLLCLSSFVTLIAVQRYQSKGNESIYMLVALCSTSFATAVCSVILTAKLNNFCPIQRDMIRWSEQNCDDKTLKQMRLHLARNALFVLLVCEGIAVMKAVNVASFNWETVFSINKDSDFQNKSVEFLQAFFKYQAKSSSSAFPCAWVIIVYNFNILAVGHFIFLVKMLNILFERMANLTAKQTWTDCHSTRQLQVRHSQLCAIVRSINELYSPVILTWFATFMINVTFNTRALIIGSDQSQEYYIEVVSSLISDVLILLGLVMFAAQVNDQVLYVYYTRHNSKIRSVRLQKNE